MKNKIINFCQNAISLLNKSNNFGADFVILKISFFNQFQNHLVFSTRFGADFFEETLNRLKNNLPIVPDKNLPLGEYDRNFNEWLKSLI